MIERRYGLGKDQSKPRLIGTQWHSDIESLSSKELFSDNKFFRRKSIGFTFLVGATLIFLWTGRIVPIMINDRFPPEIAGVTTLVSQGIDWAMVVPLMLSTGTLLWRRSAWGYLLPGVSLGYGLLMSITLPAFIFVPLIQEGKTTLVEAIPFSLVPLAGIYLVGRFYACVQDEPASQSRSKYGKGVSNE